MSDDRTVHARYKDMEIARYDRAGKWYLEPTIPGLRRQQVKLKDAVRMAHWGIDNASGEVYLDLPGGQAFDHAFRSTASTDRMVVAGDTKTQ